MAFETGLAQDLVFLIKTQRLLALAVLSVSCAHKIWSMACRGSYKVWS